MSDEVGEYDTPFNKSRPVSSPKVMANAERTFKEPNKCSSCEYESRCFWLLKLLPSLCNQGRRKKKPQTLITDFPEKVVE